MAWSPITKKMASERFWSPVNEQAGLLIEIFYSGECSYEELIDCLDDYCDSSIMGNRLNSPVFRRALIKVLREVISPDIPVIEQIEPDYPPEWDMVA